MLQIRHGVFETNSSSTHSITICKKSEYDAWKNGELLFDYWDEKFIESNKATDSQMIDAKNDYEAQRDMYQKEWDDLSDEAKSNWCEQYMKDSGYHEEYQTYNEYMHYSDLETYSTTYVSEHGDEIVVFGKYGYDY